MIRYVPALVLTCVDFRLTLRQYLVVSLGDAKQSTPTISKTLNPEWNVSFDLPVVGVESLLLEAVCWDKDRFGKDYLGEFDVAVEEIFPDGQVSQIVSSVKLCYRLSTKVP